MTASIAFAVAAGAVLGLGLWMLVSLVPRLGRPRLTTRLAPYLVDMSAEAREMLRDRRTDPLPVLGAMTAPLLDGALRMIETVFGGEAVIRTRLRQSGSTAAVGSHRTRQLIGASLGAAAGLAIGLVAGRQGVAMIPAGIAGAVGGLIAGVAVTDALLGRAARRRVRRIAQEFPTVVEFLALSVAAGESIHDAVRRAAATGSGELAGELARVVHRTGAGQALTTSLAELREDLQIPAVSRLVDQVLAALDRGTPLAEVLRAHALDARDESKRLLLEAAGTREVAMLVPLVFLILPVTVLFAVFPGLMVLQLGF